MREADPPQQTVEPRSVVSGVQLIQRGHCRLRNWRHANLSDPFWRWYWHDRNGAVIRTANEEIKLRPNRVYLIPPHTPVASDVRGATIQLFLHFTVGTRLNAADHHVITRTPSPPEWRLIKNLYRLMDSKNGGFQADYLAQGLIALCMSEIPSKSWEVPKVDPNIARVLAFMHNRLANPLDNLTLMKVAAISGNTFLRRFREATGTTPHQYLCRLRVDSAAADLRKTSDPIELIASRNGFCDRFHFARAFQKACGISPASYRKSADGR